MGSLPSAQDYLEWSGNQGCSRTELPWSWQHGICLVITAPMDSGSTELQPRREMCKGLLIAICYRGRHWWLLSYCFKSWADALQKRKCLQLAEKCACLSLQTWPHSSYWPHGTAWDWKVWTSAKWRHFWLYHEHSRATRWIFLGKVRSDFRSCIYSRPNQVPQEGFSQFSMYVTNHPALLLSYICYIWSFSWFFLAYLFHCCISHYKAVPCSAIKVRHVPVSLSKGQLPPINIKAMKQPSREAVHQLSPQFLPQGSECKIKQFLRVSLVMF